MKPRWLLTGLCIVVAIGTWGGRCAAADPTRDPALWPFSATSPWNMPIGSNAQYAAISAPHFDQSGGAGSGGINCTNWNIPVYQAAATDPLTPIYLYWPWTGITTTYGGIYPTVRVPVAAAPSPDSDAHLAIIDPTHSRAVELFMAVRNADGSLTSNWACVTNYNLGGSGIGQGGTRAYGGSSLGGLIRTGELTNGIHHALAISNWPDSHNMNGPNGLPYVWPACAADGNAADAYGTTGNLYMGSLLAIPRSVNLATLGLSGGDLAIAKALQNYGAYITDSGGSNFQLYADQTCGTEISKLNRDYVGAPSVLNTLVPLLRLVTNNSPTLVGGGGTPCQPLAPAFSPVPIPEPSSLVLLATGLIGLLAYVWRKRKCVPS